MSSFPTDPTLEEQYIPLLDAYLASLQSGREQDRAKLLSDHPDLAITLECLEALEQLAPPSSRPSKSGGAELHPATPHQPTHVENTGRETDTPSFMWSTGSTGDFGKYELLEEIGRGGMGVVYKARQKELDRLVAIKMILASQLATPEQVSRFHAEARAAARLHHSHIVNVFEAGQIHGQHYFAMQFMAGPSLDQVVRAGPLSMEAAARHVSTVARTVHYLHLQGIVHRDLKPSNILLDDQGEACVTDFGLVKMLESDSHMTTTGAIVGTPSYMAPEQASGRSGAVGPLSDIYSLGAILFELLTGVPPFRAETPLDTLVQVLEGEPPRPRQLRPDIPRELEIICLKCLEKDPQERYASAEALADDLDRFRRGEDIDARRPGWWQRLRRWARREPALASRLGTLTILIVIIQANYFLSRSVSLELHAKILVILTAWALVSWLCQWLLRREWSPALVPLVWSAADVIMLTSLLILDEASSSQLVVGYPVLIGASGLWFRVQLVWFTTALIELGYVVLVIDAALREGQLLDPHRHLIFMVALAALAFIVAYQVYRVRVLSRYFENRPLP
jgi:serine/threonine-protein kinase